MVSQRKAWKLFGWKEYICPSCKRDKGMIYLDMDEELRYSCFCGVNIKLESIQKEYNFDNKKFQSVAKNEPPKSHSKKQNEDSTRENDRPKEDKEDI